MMHKQSDWRDIFQCPSCDGTIPSQSVCCILVHCFSVSSEMIEFCKVSYKNYQIVTSIFKFESTVCIALGGMRSQQSQGVSLPKKYYVFINLAVKIVIHAHTG